MSPQKKPPTLNKPSPIRLPETFPESSVTSTFIELYGLCGAGKSTITNSLIPYFETGCRGLDVARPISPGGIRTISRAARLALRATIVDPVGVGRFLSHRQGNALFLKLGLRIASMEVRKARPRTLLVDSGILQPIVSYLIEMNIGKLNAPLRALLSIVPFPSAVVYVRVKPEVAYHRYLERQGVFRDRTIHQDLRSRFDDGYVFCEWLHEYCNFMSVPNIVVDASEQLTPYQLADLAGRIMELSPPK